MKNKRFGSASSLISHFLVCFFFFFFFLLIIKMTFHLNSEKKSYDYK